MFIQTLITEPIHFFRIVVIVIFSITLHELAHGWAAMSQGDNTPQQTGHLTLNPVVHMGKESIDPSENSQANIYKALRPVLADSVSTKKSVFDIVSDSLE